MQDTEGGASARPAESGVARRNMTSHDTSHGVSLPCPILLGRERALVSPRFVVAAAEADGENRGGGTICRMRVGGASARRSVRGTTRRNMTPHDASSMLTC